MPRAFGEVRVGSEGDGFLARRDVRPEREETWRRFSADAKAVSSFASTTTRVCATAVSFRLLKELREIRINGEAYSRRTVLLPKPTGHREARVQLLAAEQAEAGLQWGVRRLQPEPDREQALYRLKTGFGAVSVEVRPPRVWWRIGGGEG